MVPSITDGFIIRELKENDKKSLSINKSSVRFESCNDIKNQLNKEKIILNARGIKYEVLLNVLEKLPKSRLGKLKIEIEKNKIEKIENDIALMKLCDDFDLNKNEYYFNKEAS